MIIKQKTRIDVTKYGLYRYTSVAARRETSIANCPTRGKQLCLETMGHTITSGGFFNIEVDPNQDRGQAEQFAAIVQFKSTHLTAEQFFGELKHLVDEPLDWQVVKLMDSEFSFQLPSRATFKLTTGSGKIVLSLSKTEVSIRESFRRPTPGKALPLFGYRSPGCQRTRWRLTGSWRPW
jgi:hypothetical protein